MNPLKNECAHSINMTSTLIKGKGKHNQGSHWVFFFLEGSATHEKGTTLNFLNLHSSHLKKPKKLSLSTTEQD